jgi:GT2 family glycosyltransferase
MDISISIVNRNTKDLLCQCLKSIYNTDRAGLFGQGVNFEVIVADNGSADGSIEVVRKDFSEVNLITNHSNLFFTVATNQTIKASKGEYILLLNSDTVVKSNSIKKMFDFLENNQEVGAVSCRMFFPDGRIQKNCSAHIRFKTLLFNSTFLGRIFKNIKNGLIAEYLIEEWDRQTSRGTDIIPFSCIMIRMKVFEDIGLFDENLNLYYVENDMCLRMQEKRWKRYYLADGEIIHYERQSVKKEGIKGISKVYLEDTIEFSRKYFGRMNTFLLQIFLFVTNLLLSIVLLRKENIFVRFLTEKNKKK